MNSMPETPVLHWIWKWTNFPINLVTSSNWWVRLKHLPILGESLWFNHATRKHATVWTCHPGWGKLGGPYTRMPTHSYYGDGSDIPADVIQHIRDVSWQCAVGFQMQRGFLIEFFYNSSFPAKSWQDSASIIHMFSGRIYFHMIQ